MLNFLLIALSGFAFAQEKVQVKNVTPQGYVKSVGQIRIEFSKPMVKFGDIRLDYPAQSECFKEGEGRWVDTKNWVYDFKDMLPGGRNCTIAVSGKTYQFNTGGPHVLSSFPRLYRPIDPEQNFVLILDAPVNKDSIASAAYFVVKGLGDRLPAALVEGSSAKKIIDAAITEYKYDEEDFKRGHPVVVRSARAFPAGSEVTLVWSKGVKAESGSSSPEDETFEYNVAAPFKVEFSCDREAAGRPCIPLLGFRLNFTSAISIADAKKIYIESEDKKKIFASNLDDPKDSTTSIEFKGPFATKSIFKIYLPSSLKDLEGRELTNGKQYPLTVKTGDDPVLLKFSADFGIIEAGPEAAVAVTLRRVEKSLHTRFAGWTGKLAAGKFKEIIDLLGAVRKEPYDSKRLSINKNIKVQNIQVQKPLKSSDMEVVGIPLKAKGLYFVEMESPLLGQGLLDKKQPFYVRTAALVTNMAVHVKHSQNESWIWVTSLKDAQVVSGAKIRIYDLNGAIAGEATSDRRGLANIKFKKPLGDWPTDGNSGFYSGFFAVAEKGDDFSFTHSSWSEGVESWRFQLGLYDATSGLVGHAILDRSLFKPEETLSAKIVLRKTASRGLVMPSEKEWPEKLVLAHDSGIQSFELPLFWDKKKGTALIKWTLPPGTKMGNWSLTAKGAKPEVQIQVGKFSVEAFRIPLIQVKINTTSPVFIKEKTIPVQVNANFFSGGPAVDLPMKMRWSVEPDGFTAQDDDFMQFSFANGSIKEGVFRAGEDEGARFIPKSGSEEYKLNSSGDSTVKLKDMKYGLGPQRLRVEVEYKDPNGEIQSSIRSFAMWSSKVILGIKAKAWWATPNLVEFDVVALDISQKPLAKQKVQVDLYTSRYYSHRKRLVGGFYSYEDIREFKKIGELCQGETNEKGMFNCVGKSKIGGSVIAVVRTKDSDGNESFANVNQWLIEPGQRQWFGAEDDDRADLIPFKKTYEPGETAEFQLRTPFPTAKVLVTVERDSIIHSEVIEVRGDRPVFKLPIKKEYAPNVVISAFAIRGRLSEPKPTALVDLGKPAFKLGMVNLKVGWKENTLKVTVSADRKVYKARDKAQVTVQVKDSAGRPAKKGDVALIAVDEGLLELRDNKSWDILSEMMKMRSHTIDFATAQSLVIGKRHFGLKALPIGGDGGGGLRRELFDSLLYWNPSVSLDAQGQARVEVPLNDSTTSFRIVAVALQNTDQFGTGWTSIQSSQDLMILPGLSSIAREGDEFKASFTVRNASAQAQDVDVALRVKPEMPGISSQKISLRSGESKEIFWNIKVPALTSSLKELEYVVSARDNKGKFLDEIKKTQKILPLRIARVYQSEWGAWPEFAKVAIKPPAGADPDKNSIIMEVSDGLGGSLSGIEEYWNNYAYTCLEQQVSRVISLDDKMAWQRLESKIATYMDPGGLLKYFPSSAIGSVNLTAYVLSVSHEAGFSFGDETQDKMLSALAAYAEGRSAETSEYNRADETLKKITVFETLSRYRRLNLDVLSTIDYQPSQWPLYTLTEWYQIHLWEKSIPGVEKKRTDIESILRNKFYFSSKRLQLRDEKLDMMSWLMRDSDSAIMRLVLTTLSLQNWKTDVPRLYQGILSRQEKGAWAMTTDNAWGALMIRKVNAEYSKDKVTGVMKLSLGKTTQTHNWAKPAKSSYEFPWKNESQASWQQTGTGKPWLTVSVKASVPSTKPVFAGFSVEKKITALEQKKKGTWSVGDVAKIELKVKTQAPQTWVVIEDPIPAGSSILKNSYAAATERKDDLIRSYYSWFPGEETMEYTVRFNQSGSFVLPVTRVEAMYSPDLFAELPESTWKVQE